MPSKPDFQHAITHGKSWLALCLATHKSCAKKARHANIFCSDNSHLITDLSGSGLVPSRLLSFETTAPQSDEDIVKLVLSTKLDEHTQYVALSHRWGNPAESAVPRTTKENFKRHVDQGMRYAALPRTFRDAIDVTRGMGYGYLWIDSLCIIQGSARDWKKEARRMAIIYDNAVFTIAAMDAEDSTRGLWPVGGGCAESLDSRAWVCQERMIAPRTLLFTRGSVDWECREATANSLAPVFLEEDGGSVNGCERHDWIPPTRPKAIFAFFRDWRLPPLPKEQVDEPGTASASPAHGPDIAGDIDGQKKLDNEHSKENEHLPAVAEEMSALTISAENNPTTKPDSEIPVQDSSNPHSDVEEINPIEPKVPLPETLADFTWSDDDPPIKVWNMPPPAGESGIFVDHQNNVIWSCYGSDLRAHAQNMRTQSDFPVLDQAWETHPENTSQSAEDPFGNFMVVVTNLPRPEAAFEPFMRVWWNFLALYTPRNLTFDSDAFLAMNGITSIAQRWTHIRNSFGLWYAFPQYELCWYVDARGGAAVRPSTPEWIVPSWSWASTRGGLVRNAAWARIARKANLMIKPVIGGGTGTAFDKPLPMQAWRHIRYHDLEIKGNLRAAKMKCVRATAGESGFELHVESTGRFSDHEVIVFYPDCPAELPLNGEIDVWTLLIWHYGADDPAGDMGSHVDIHLVLVSIKNDKWLSHYGPDTMEMEVVEDERTMRRIGLAEMMYRKDQKRDPDAILEDMWWKFVRLV